MGQKMNPIWVEVVQVCTLPCVYLPSLAPSPSSQKYNWAEIQSASVWPAQSGGLSDAWLDFPSPKPAGYTPATPRAG